LQDPKDYVTRFETSATCSGVGGLCLQC